MPPQEALEKLSGHIERITFHSEDTGFCVLRVKVRGKTDLVTIIGNAATVTSGEYLECHGTWVNDKNHGLQFKAQELKLVPPTSSEGIEKYLASGMIRGVGTHFAKVLVKAFGTEIFDVLENSPHRLSKLPGIGEKRKEQILTSWVEQKAIRDIMIFLQGNGIGTARAVRIYKTYGTNAIDKIRANPYCLALDVYGIGFKTADEFALRIGIGKISILRAQAGVRHVLQEFASDGHCAVLEEKVLASAVEILEIPEEVIQKAIELEIKEENITSEKFDEENFLFLTALYKAEDLSAKHIFRLKTGQPIWGSIDSKKALDWVESTTGLALSASQRSAIALALREKVLIITGGPGVGKTTIINSFLKIVRAKGVSVALCAPTGRAAKRLSETTHLQAKTIHRLLEYDAQKHNFTRHQFNPLVTDLVIVDEASMIDIVLFYNLLKAIPNHAALILVGDVDQLPSVGPGSVLSDLIKSECIPTVRLTEIFRQAASSQIIVNAHRVNQGQLPFSNQDEDRKTDFYLIQAETPEKIQEKLLYVVTERIPERFGFHPLRDIQVLTPMNRGGLGARAINQFLQTALNPRGEPKITRFGTAFAVGDKVMQVVNNYDKDVFNGDIGCIKIIDLENQEVHIDFDGKMAAYSYNDLDELMLAYATTIHKSQGSEYPCVVIPLATQHYMLLARNLLYTAITRGRKLVVLIGQMKAIAMAVKNEKTSQRVTKLIQRLNKI